MRRPEDWPDWAAHVDSADAPPAFVSQPAASAAHSQVDVCSVLNSDVAVRTASIGSPGHAPYVQLVSCTV